MSSSKHSHDPSRWIDKVRQYYPLDFPPSVYFYSNRFYKLITRWSDGRRFKSILEVGCGSCLAPICVKLMHPWKRVVACDVSEEIVEFAKERLRRWGVGIELHVADARDLPFGDDEFDSLLSEGLLEHWPESDRIAMLQEMCRVAKRLVVDLPVNYRYGIQIGGYGDEEIKPPEYWRELFNRCSLRIVEEFIREKRGERIIRAGWVLE